MTESALSNDIYVRFFIRGKDIDPNNVTSLLGITPSYKYMRGDRHGKQNRLVRDQGFWSIASDGKVQSSDLEAHLEWLLAQLEAVKDRLDLIISTNGVHAQISCVYNLFTLEWDERLRPEMLKRIAELNIQFGISIYCLAELDNKLDEDLDG